MNSIFKIGNRIRIVKDISGTPVVGDEGTVIDVGLHSVSVCFDRFHELGFHNCGGKCKDGHGWFLFSYEYNRECFELIEDDNMDEITFDELIAVLDGL